MICPKCKAQYIRGIYVCADCDVPLVDQLPDDEQPENAEDIGCQDATFLDVYVTGNAGEIALIRSLLDDAGIDYHFSGERFSMLHSGVYPSRLFVREDQCEEALEILRDLNFGVFGEVDEASE
ncbi:MAG: DUF2007 domain-containing protein [candidate division WOR-3 bacterium]|nr:MAG: DUF2007 domain-containing protein [candidate division WOR-3 bacterium]